MEHLALLRQWLASQKENWPAIARETSLSVKTLSRIVNDASYSCTMTTFAALDKERAKQVAALERRLKRKAVPA